VAKIFWSVFMNLIKREPGLLARPDTFFTDRFFDAFLRNIPAFPSLDVDLDFDDGAIALRVDVVENDKNYQVTAELPGVPKENIDVSVEDGVLTIKAHVESETKKEKKGQVVRQERYEGRFVRRLDLGSAAASEGIDANLKDGVLKITVPKVEGKVAKPVKIRVD